MNIREIDSLEPVNKTFTKTQNVTEKLEENISKIQNSSEKKELLQKWLEYSSEEEENEEIKIKKSKKLYIAIEKITDPVNLGSIIRSASFFKVDGIILPEKDTCPVK